MTKLWDYPKYGCPFKRGETYYYFYNEGLQNQRYRYIHYNTTTTTIVLQPFSLLTQGVGWWLLTAVSSTSHAPAHPPFSNHALSCPSLLHDFTSSSAFSSLSPSTSYDMLFFTQSLSSFHNACPSHLNRFRFTTSDSNSIPILSVRDTLHIHRTIHHVCTIIIYTL